MHSPSIKCRACYAKIEPGNKRCSNCGLKLDSGNKGMGCGLAGCGLTGCGMGCGFIFGIAILFGVIAYSIPPSQPATVTDQQIHNAISSSDDYSKYREEFLVASRKLVDRGTDINVLQYNGGWVRSQSEPGNVYFTYTKAEDASINDRIYLNIDTGALYR